jgi:hypothetical protein
VVQTLPLGLVPHPAWSLAASALSEELVGAISINPTETWWAITRWLTAGGVFLAAFSLARDRHLAIFLVRGFLVLAAGAALYGLVRVAFSLDKILWLDVAGRSLLTSGFLNQNSAATFFGMSSLAALALVMEGARNVVRDATSGRDMVRRGSDQLAGGLGFDLVLFFASFVALAGDRLTRWDLCHPCRGAGPGCALRFKGPIETAGQRGQLDPGDCVRRWFGGGGV